MASKSCIKCDQPRMMSSSGKTLTMCEAHQREYWRSKKPSSTSRRSTKRTITKRPISGRRCKQCKTQKPLAEFGQWGAGYKRTCLDCENESVDTDSTAPQQSDKKYIVLVEPNQVILAEVISQVPSLRQKQIVLDMYKRRGYEVIHVFESERES